MPTLYPDAPLEVLLWILAAMVLQFVLVIVAGAWLQRRKNRLNRLRIACCRRWEDQIVLHLFRGSDSGIFGRLPPQERRLFIPFLLRVLGTLAGSEGEQVIALHARLGLNEDLGARLRSRHPTTRALAALEVGSFKVEKHYPRLVALLADTVPHVAHAAARGLGSTGRISYAGQVLDWVLGQEVFQLDRMLWILEAFGDDFLPWMERRLDAQESPNPRECMIYALVAASLRNPSDTARLEALLGMDETEIQTAALKALGALGHPEALPAVLPFAGSDSWVLRAQAAKAIGTLAGPGGIPGLLDLLADTSFDVRRNAAHALARMGPAGVSALAWVAGDPTADPFARDLASERLQWTFFGGHR